MLPTKIPRLVVILFFLFVLVNLGLFALLKYKKNTTKNLSSPTPSPNFFPKEKITSPQTVIPWANADDELAVEPVTLSAKELNSIYVLVRQAMDERDEKTFLGLVSAERVWHMANWKKVAGETADGEVIFVRISNSESAGRLPEMHWQAPEINDVIPVKVETSSINSVEEFILLDEATGKSEKVINTPWKYVAVLLYETKKEAINQGNGKVTFVFDRGKWRYQGEYWTLKPRGAYFFGNPVGPEGKIYEVKSSGEGGYSPKVLSILKGEAVVWKDAPGLIYSYSTNQKHWTSPFLMKGDTFTKVFNQTGDYYYYILNNKGEFKGEVHVK